MDSTLELLNYSPRIMITEHECEKDDPVSLFLPNEESGFQEDFPERASVTPFGVYPSPVCPFDSWFSTESDMLILYELLGEFYDEEFEKLSYEEKKTLKDKVETMEPKSHEELMELYPDNNDSINESQAQSSSVSNAQLNIAIDNRDQVEEEKEATKETKETKEVTPLCPLKKQFSEWFEPLEELILFDLLGIDYREAFNDMNQEQRMELRKKVDRTEPKSKEEILAMLNEEEMQHKERQQDKDKETETEKGVLFIAPSITSRKREQSRRLTLLAQQPKKRSTHSSSCCSVSSRGSYSSTLVPSYRRPTSASANKEHTPRSNNKLHCPRLYEGNPNVIPFSPKEFHSRRRLHTGIDLSKVISPVAQYIHSSPTPTLIRNVKSSHLSKLFLLESAKENNPPPPSPSKDAFPDLPQANYKSSPLLTEQEVDANPKNCFSPTGTAVEPKIFRHLGRVKVPRSLQLDERGHENLDKLLSPSSPCKMTLRRNHARESIGVNDSMVDMSVHEVKTIKSLRNDHVDY